MSISWRSASGRASLSTNGRAGYGRLAIDDPIASPTSESLSVDELRALRDAIDEHLREPQEPIQAP